MKTITIIALTLAVSSNAFAATQQQRIAQGVATGSLTKVETSVLVRQQTNIATAAASGASASTVSAMKQAASTNIYKLKHN